MVIFVCLFEYSFFLKIRISFSWIRFFLRISIRFFLRIRNRFFGSNFFCRIRIRFFEYSDTFYFKFGSDFFENPDLIFLDGPCRFKWKVWEGRGAKYLNWNVTPKGVDGWLQGDRFSFSFSLLFCLCMSVCLFFISFSIEILRPKKETAGCRETDFLSPSYSVSVCLSVCLFVCLSVCLFFISFSIEILRPKKETAGCRETDFLSPSYSVSVCLTVCLYFLSLSFLIEILQP